MKNHYFDYISFSDEQSNLSQKQECNLEKSS